MLSIVILNTHVELCAGLAHELAFGLTSTSPTFEPRRQELERALPTLISIAIMMYIVRQLMSPIGAGGASSSGGASGV